MKKTVSLTVVAIVFLLSFSINVHSQQAEIKEFKVYGNCNMCKKRIENGALKVEGVSSAIWDKGTKMIKITIAESVPTGDVSKAIAAVGHDTDFDTAKDSVYAKLPVCCQYDREISNAATSEIVKTISFDVAGNCGMCKKKIEKAAKSIEGVVIANWDKEKKTITVGLAGMEVTKELISQAIAAIGYDTEFDQASVDVYNALPGCCKYERLLYEKY